MKLNWDFSRGGPGNSNQKNCPWWWGGGRIGGGGMSIF